MTHSDIPNLHTTLRDDNLDCLTRMSRLIERLSDEQYSLDVTPCVSGIGAHVRHILDHYDALLAGIASGTVDYDARQRDKQTEYNRTIALQRIAKTRAALMALPTQALQQELLVCMDCGSTASSRMATHSNTARELQFLVSHTVHHDALIAAAIVALDIEPEAGYGVAPSTLRHQRQRA
ncbi:MAG: DinB family protein [Pseudomonadota bacterium]